MSNLPQTEGFYIFRRKGTADDPFVPLQETLTVFETKVYLSEIPSKTNRVTVSGQGIQWYEVDTPHVDLQVNEYRVNYILGIVEFHVSNNNKSLQFNFFGTGSISVPSSRITAESDNGVPTKTLKEVINEANTALTTFTHRGDYSSSATYYPRNIVNYNGLTYINNVQSINILPTQTSHWQRIFIDTIQLKIESRTSDPTNPEVGRIWLRTDLG